MTQLSFGGLLEDDDAAVKGMVSAFGFGYVFGFADQLLQIARATDEVEAMAQLTLIFARLFGEEEDAKIFGKCLRSQNDAEFRAARLLGAQEVLLVRLEDLAKHEAPLLAGRPSLAIASSLTAPSDLGRVSRRGGEASRPTTC